MKKIYPIIILILLLGAGLFFRSNFENLYHKLTGKYEAIKELALEATEEKIQKEVIAPPPLRSEQEAAVSHLTKEGVINFTNQERLRNNRKKLSENQKLNEAAQMKLEDMFRNQYFDHVSPTGIGPADLAESAGYEYISVGENLALGNFENDRALVEAWMASPGHRENILHASFSEIGVAVGKGVFEGKTVWLAVQEFGRPDSACPKVDAKLKKRIEENEKDIAAMKADLAERKKEIEKSESSESAQAKIEEYNNLVRQYNTLVNETKSLITQYNRQVSRFNECIRE